ncbi:MAG: 50S ribosomal protein L31e [Nanoarchaeota archaeon]|nr:50S ribosomal protein L31e [Nanoarchaeota archaeon]
MVRTKIGEERIFNISLRKNVEKVPRYKRTQKAVKVLRAFIAKHMKCEKVVIGKYLNMKLWERGKKNPPLKLNVKAVKESVDIKNKKGVEIVRVEIIGAPEEKKEPKKKKFLERLRGKTEEKPKEENKLEEKSGEEKEEIEKKKVLEHTKLDKHYIDVVGASKSGFQLKSQKLKKKGIIGSTGKK